MIFFQQYALLLWYTRSVCVTRRVTPLLTLMRGVHLTCAAPAASVLMVLYVQTALASVKRTAHACTMDRSFL